MPSHDKCHVEIQAEPKPGLGQKLKKMKSIQSDLIPPKFDQIANIMFFFSLFLKFFLFSLIYFIFILERFLG